MLEKDIENLIARYPNEFFPHEELKLNGQQIKLGKCYADILFTDKHDRTIIIEVKRGILSREAAGQIIEYYGLIKQDNPNLIVELILCANVIPHERKLFLENIGISCKELGIGLIFSVAHKYNYTLKSDEKGETSASPKHPDLTAASQEKGIWIFQANPNRFDVLNALTDKDLNVQCWQVNQYKDKIQKGDIGLIWMSGKDAGIYAVVDIISEPVEMTDFIAEDKYWVSEVDRGKKRLKVIIKIKRNLVNSPLFRHELADNKELNELSIFKFSQGTNFPVTHNEWAVISKMINDRLMPKLT